jgi:predicted anti-sigma-YlaC factor YlaD
MAAAESPALPPSMEAHLAACPSCREQVEAVRFMRRLASAPTPAHQLPDQAVIWWKAQLLRRWQAERAATAPIEGMRWIELAAGLASLAVFLVWQWEGLLNLLSRATPADFAAMFAAPPLGSPLATVLIIGVVVSIGGLVLAALQRRLGGAAS